MLCIPRDKIEAFKKALKNQEIKVSDLINMTTEARTALLEKFAGENAKTVNTLFEEKLILKNRVQGIKNWMSKVGELGRYDPVKKAKLEQLMSEYRARQQERMFNPKENEAFLADLVEEKFGTKISEVEAKNVFHLTQKADELFKNVDNTSSDPQLWKWKYGTEKAGAEYGASKVILKKYVDNLKSGNLSVKGMLKEYSQEIKTLWKEDKIKTTAKIIGDSIDTLRKSTTNAVASWDNSFIARQGALTLIKSPKTWWNMAKKSMTDFYQTLKGSNPEDVLMADVYSDIDYINGNYKKAKLSFGIEEEVPTQLLEKIPVVGRIFEASNVAFTDSAIRARQGLFKIQKRIYEKTGMPLNDAILRDIGTTVNAITARGKVGQIGSSKIVQTLMWAPRMLKADWDILTGHTFGVGLETKFGRIQAAKTIFNVVVATAAITAIAKAMGADVETDPRSSGFLKIKIGNTRINSPFIRGMPQIVTLFARLLTQSSKSAQTGIITKLNSGNFYSKNLFDIGMDFLTNKTTPPVGAVIAWAKNKTFSGKQPTIGSTGFGFLPISVQNFIQLKDDHSTQAVFGAFAELFGISASTYTQETDWNQNLGVEFAQFKEKIGDKKFQEANDRYNQFFNIWFEQIQTNEKYKTLTDEQKKQSIKNKRAEIKDGIFKMYGFEYKQEKSEKLPKL